MFMDVIFLLYCGMLLLYWFLMKYRYDYIIELYVKIKMKCADLPFMSLF